MFHYYVRDGHKHDWNWKYTCGQYSNFSDYCPHGVEKPKHCIHRNFIMPKFIGEFRTNKREMKKEMEDIEIQSIISLHTTDPTWIKTNCKLEDNEYVYCGYPVCCIHEYYEMIGATMELLSECYDSTQEICKFCMTPLTFEHEHKSILDNDDLRMISDFYLEIITVFDNVITFQLMCELLSTPKCHDIVCSVVNALSLDVKSVEGDTYTKISDQEIDKFIASIQLTKNNHSDYTYFVRNKDEEKLYHMSNDMAALYQTMKYIEDVNSIHAIDKKFKIGSIKCGNTTFKPIKSNEAKTSWLQLFAFCPKNYPYHIFNKNDKCEKCGWKQDEESAKDIDIVPYPNHRWIMTDPTFEDRIQLKVQPCILTIPPRLVDEFILFVRYALRVKNKISVEEAVKLYGQDTKYWLMMNTN